MNNPFKEEYGWRRSAVTVRLPNEKSKWPSESAAPEMIIDGVWHRDLIDIITSTFQSEQFKTFHTTPFRQCWQVSDDHVIDILSEAYSSPEMLHAHEDVNKLPCELDGDLEHVVACLMLWSDSTHLTNFRDTSMWPFYMYFGNQSKYLRGKPTAMACHHVAYIPKLPDNFQDIYRGHYSQVSSREILTHCKHDLFHAIWDLILDTWFMDAYQSGIVIWCADGITRQIYPHFFSYSADYPEKVLVAGIKFLGKCACPRCLIAKKSFSKMGMAHDMRHRVRHVRMDSIERQGRISQAHKLIFQKGAAVNGKRVGYQLDKHSYVPMTNAFSERLLQFMVNFFLLLVVDQLHEFELGVWKAIFTHLLRVLFVAGGDGIQELNKRFRNIPTFGRGMIWKFACNVSAMKRLAA
ncbi:hypothetical protein M404DRAFT_142158 [Pisolithus tinctorius Marx 270]|uniref:Uncharacterized protein n=1 Tax=Pisolithus tinctorius Marx 270 TaxID=870435 RepID=A0A0C3PB41_PISTI|nr:hypothetical protein M404DRAFT_142158 [Pisolithus tinctorius Marx 270]